MMIPLSHDEKIPLYQQIYDHIRLEIMDGKIPQGEKLPSTRFLSSHLQVSRSTVEFIRLKRKQPAAKGRRAKTC